MAKKIIKKVVKKKCDCTSCMCFGRSPSNKSKSSKVAKLKKLAKSVKKKLVKKVIKKKK